MVFPANLFRPGSGDRPPHLAGREREIMAVAPMNKVLAGIVHDTVALEGNPFTFPEVKTLLEGVTAGGHKAEDADRLIVRCRKRPVAALVDEAPAQTAPAGRCGLGAG